MNTDLEAILEKYKWITTSYYDKDTAQWVNDKGHRIYPKQLPPSSDRDVVLLAAMGYLPPGANYTNETGWIDKDTGFDLFSSKTKNHEKVTINGVQLTYRELENIEDKIMKNTPEELKLNIKEGLINYYAKDNIFVIWEPNKNNEEYITALHALKIFEQLNSLQGGHFLEFQERVREIKNKIEGLRCVALSPDREIKIATDAENQINIVHTNINKEGFWVTNNQNKPLVAISAGGSITGDKVILYSDHIIGDLLRQNHITIPNELQNPIRMAREIIETENKKTEFIKKEGLAAAYIAIDGDTSDEMRSGLMVLQTFHPHKLCDAVFFKDQKNSSEISQVNGLPVAKVYLKLGKCAHVDTDKRRGQYPSADEQLYIAESGFDSVEITRSGRGVRSSEYMIMDASSLICTEKELNELTTKRDKRVEINKNLDEREF